MVTNIVSICGLCICAAMICKITEKYSKEQSMLLILAVSTVILFTAVTSLPPVLDKITNLMSETELSGEYIEILFKALGICFITQLACDICKDCNENAIATAAETAGKIELIIMALPLFENLIDMTAVILE